MSTRTDAVARVRAQLDHPVIDADGHLIEFVPLVEELAHEVGGGDLVDGFRRWLAPPTGPLRSRPRPGKRVFYSFPGEALDRATATVPHLLYDRLDEIGIDFSMLYPTVGLGVLALPDADLRAGLARALNAYYATVTEGLRDRLEPVAVIPLVHPTEALELLEHAVVDLGFRAFVTSAIVHRTELRTDGSTAQWIDTVGHESAYDYDPFWRRCVELRVAPSFHMVGYGWGTRTSRTNYVYNHLGNFAAGQEPACRSIVMGGVAARFPELSFSFLEGGVAWACQLFADLVGHYGKRNRDAIGSLDPGGVDLDRFDDLFRRHARGRLAAHRLGRDGVLFGRGAVAEDPASIDDFAEARITGIDDIVRMFTTQFSFGCEADDPLNRLAFDRGLNPGHTQLRAMFASDIGHWDVPDMRGVLPEAYEAVDEGVLSAEDFRKFTYENAWRTLTAVRPDFFAPTAIAGAAAPLEAVR